jgi:hypothetical protein
MSGFPIMSSPHSIPAYQRSGVATAPPPVSNDLAATKPVTAVAVQQMRKGESMPALARHVLPPPQDKRARLVGPPPAFEVNVLQHMRETRGAPEPPAPADSDGVTAPGTVAQDTGDAVATEDRAAQTVYTTLGGLGSRADDSAQAMIDKVL